VAAAGPGSSARVGGPRRSTSGRGASVSWVVAEEIWRTAAAGEEITIEQIARARLAGSYAADCANQATDWMYRAGGTTSIEWEHALARAWRDVHVVAQNFSLLPEYYMVGGRVFLGLDPGPKLA